MSPQTRLMGHNTTTDPTPPSTPGLETTTPWWNTEALQAALRETGPSSPAYLAALRSWLAVSDQAEPTTPPVGADMDPNSTRLPAFLHGVRTRLEEQARETPTWDAETLLDLTKGALRSFWRYLTEATPPDGWTRVDTWAGPVAGPSWSNPEVELRFSVPFDWATETVITNQFTTTDLGTNPEKWVEAGQAFFLSHRALSLFDLVTRGGRIQTEGTSLKVDIPHDLLAQYPDLPDLLRTQTTWASLDPADAPPNAHEARAAYEARYRPFVLSPAALVRLVPDVIFPTLEALRGDEGPPISGREIWDRIPDSARRPLRYLGLDGATNEPDYQTDLLALGGTVRETPFTANLRVAFHPLVLVASEPRRAFYPVTLALQYRGDVPLTEWTDEERRSLWNQFETLLDSALEALRDVSSTPSADPRPEEILPAPVYVGPPAVERRVFPAAFGVTRADANMLELVGSVHKVRLPVSRWGSLKSWQETIEEEIGTILDNEGDRAFHAIPQGRGPLLTRRTVRGETVTRLTEEAEHRLKIRKGLGSNGFRYRDPQNGQEYLSRVFEYRGGYLEVGLSWWGLAGPWVDEWRKGVQKDAEDRARQGALFDELDLDTQARVRRARLLRDSYRLMEAVLGQVGKQRQNPVVVHAEAFRLLLDLRDDPHWKARLEGGLDALRACEFRFKSFNTVAEKGYGSFLGGWQYRGAGPGGHGDGAYLLWVHPPFLGCLSIFESGKREIGGAFTTTFDFGKPVPEDTQAALGWGYDRKARTRRKAVARFVEFDAGRPFYSAVAGLSPTQTELHRFVETELTRRESAVSRTLGTYATRHNQRTRRDPDGRQPRVYDATVCPLLPEGRRYFAALGNFTRNAEAGWTLYGTARRESATGGAHVPGLLARMGYTLPTVARGRADVVKQALGDLKATVEEYLEGVVAAFHGGQWLTLQEASALSDEDLGRRTRWYLFVPETFHADRREKFEKATGYTVTENVEEAHRATQTAAHGPDGLPLRTRLRMARLDRKLSQAAVGQLFGVSQKTIALWETGPDPQADGKVRGTSIPAQRVPLLERWLMGGPPPSAEELAAFQK